MKSKKILVVAYYFPPFGGIPVQRTLKFVKHLLKYGWNPTVLTVLNGHDHFHPNDPSLIKKIPAGIKVIRTKELNVTARLIKSLRSKTTITSNNNSRGDKRFTKAVVSLRKVLYNSLWFPDEKNLWIPATLFAGLRLLSQDNIAAIYASGYPWSAFFLGTIFSKLKGIPLILDFRDAWTLNQRGFWDSRFHRYWEGKALLQSSKTIFATNFMRKGYIKSYPGIDSHKFITITNGFDEDDFKHHRRKSKKTGEFLITYTGTFNDNIPPLDIDRSPYYFLKGVARLLNRNKDDISRHIRIRFVCNFGKNNNDFIEKLGLENVVELTGHVSHDQSIEYQLESDLLLLLISPCAGSKSTLTGKLFEYIGSKKKILALVPDGEAKDLIVKENLGICVNPKDIEGISNAIYAFYRKWEKHELQLNQNDTVFKRFEMQTLTKRLVETLEEAIKC